MPDWYDIKRAAQSAYSGFQDMYSSVGQAYQQILLNGHLSPMLGGSNMTQQISAGNFERQNLNPEYREKDWLYQAQEEERERNEASLKDLEPEPGG